MKNIIRITASLLTAALLTAAPLTAVQSGAFLAKMPGVEVTEDTTVYELDDFFTEKLGEHILLTKTSDLFFPGAYGKEMVVLSSDGKLHLYYTELSEAAFTVTDGFDEEALTAEMRRQDITAVINYAGDNRYIIKSAHDNSYTPGNYQRLVALLEDTDEVTLIEHSYTMTEDKANAAGDLAFLFSGDISADEIMRRYSLGLTENSPFGYPAGYCTLCLGLDSSDLEKDYAEIKRLTENEDCTFSCCITELAYEWDTLWHCREVIFDRSRNAVPEPELVPGVLSGDANLDTKVTIADPVAILQHIACRDKYELKPQGLVNADVDSVAGVTANDALTLKQWDTQGKL